MKVSIELEFGDTTCAVIPGEFCRFCWSKSFGQKYVCGLFDFHSLYEKDGWLQRCPQCLAKWPPEEQNND